MALLLALAISAPMQAGEDDVRLRFKNGDYIVGALVAAKSAGHVAVACDDFESALEFNIDAVSSIERNEEEATGGGAENEWLFVLSNSSTIAGKLNSLTEEQVSITSRSLGEVSLPRSLLVEIVPATGSGKLLFKGPRSGQSWKSTPLETAWTIEAGTLMTRAAGSVVECDARLPAMCEIRVVLSWSKKPDFVLALGIDKKGKAEGQLRKLAHVRLELWGKTLVMVREVEDKLDFVSLGVLADQSQLDVILYMDQRRGTVVACHPTGKVLGSLTLKATAEPPVGELVQLMKSASDGATLQLERFDVREWNGRLPNLSNVENGGIVDKEGVATNGSIGTFDAASGMLSIEKEDKTIASVPLSNIARAMFPQEPVTESTKDELFVVQFEDESCCVGVWKSSEGGKLEMQIDGFTAPIVASLDQISTISGNEVSFKTPETKIRSGKLESELVKLTGGLAESSKPGDVVWQAEAANDSSKLRGQFAGKVVYQPVESPKAAAASQTARRRINANGIVAGGIQLMFGNAQPGRRNANQLEAGTSTKTLEAGVKLRSGDSVAGAVKQIDERGVTFLHGEQTKVIVHEKMDAVTLLDKAQIADLPPDKLKHLLTIPRVAKTDPPTHLFVGVNGDYLRGRLIKFAGGRVTAEIRQAEVEFPAEAIAQIYWLHSRNWDEKKPGEPAATIETTPPAEPTKQPEESQIALLQVHAIQKSGKSITFTPSQTLSESTESTADQLIKGQNELLGDCQIRVSDLNILLIGRDVGALVRKTQKDGWQLSVADLPKVYQDGGAAAESGSPLVGKPAPKFSLATTTDAKYVLGEVKDRVVVLDFWASWCGPCMKTMPEVERIVKEIGEDKVDLVAVNLQETKDRVLAAVKRLELTATIALDIDGEVAQQYQANAIPQTVIIDREGKVTHVFVGGGTKFLESFQEALSKATH